MEKKGIEIISVSAWDWIIPYYGNIHNCPYGTLKVKYKDLDTNEEKKVFVQTKGCALGDKEDYQYVCVNRKRFYVKQIGGTMHSPKLALEAMTRNKRGDGTFFWTSPSKPY